MTGSLGRRYARALLALAEEAGVAPAAGEQLGKVVATFADPQLRAVVLNPGVAAAARKRLVQATVDSLGVSTLVRNLVLVLADHDRLAMLPDVGRAYDRLLDQTLGRTRVRIRSASPLSPPEEQEIIAVAKRLTGREVIASTEVDATLLGGVMLDVGGTVYDASVKTRLERLSKQMVGGEG